MAQEIRRGSSSGVCNSDRIGRILNSDYSGRSFRVLPFRRPLGSPAVERAKRIADRRKRNPGGPGPARVRSEPFDAYGLCARCAGDGPAPAPAGDPTVYAIDGMEIALRVETAKAIRVPFHGSLRIGRRRTLGRLPGPRDERLLRNAHLCSLYRLLPPTARCGRLS